MHLWAEIIFLILGVFFFFKLLSYINSREIAYFPCRGRVFLEKNAGLDGLGGYFSNGSQGRFVGSYREKACAGMHEHPIAAVKLSIPFLAIDFRALHVRQGLRVDS